MFLHAMAPAIETPPPDAAVRAQLTELGLSKLIAVFAEHEVDDAAFLQLKEADLRDISISRGNRRKILTAIQTIKERDTAVSRHRVWYLHGRQRRGACRGLRAYDVFFLCCRLVRTDACRPGDGVSHVQGPVHGF